MVNRCRILLFLACALLGASRTVQAAAAELERATTRLPVGPFLSVYRDRAGTMTLEAVREAAGQGRFQKANEPWPSFGFTRDVVWARFDAVEKGGTDGLWFLMLRTARMDEVDLHVVRSKGVETLRAGNLRGPSADLEDNKFPVFPLALEAGERVEVFVRVRSETAVHLPLECWGAKAFAGAQARMEAAYAGFFGYVAALVAVAMVFGLLARDRGYLIYAACLVGFLILYLILSGYYAWLGFPATGWAVKEGVLVAAEVLLGLLTVYLRFLLDMGRTMPSVDPWVRGAIWAQLPVTMALMLLPFHVAARLLVLHDLLVGASSLTIATIASFRGSRPARYYAMAWAAYWGLFAVSQLQFFAWLPMSHTPELMAMAGAAASMTLFLVAMVDRIRAIRRDMQEARERLLALERETASGLRSQMQQDQLLIRDLHDGIGGLTANLAILAELGLREARDHPLREHLLRIARLASEGGAEVRSLINSMEARDIAWPDLIVECRRHGDTILPPHGIRFQFAEHGYCGQPGPGLFPGMSLLRVFKEALTNAVKHSGCTEVHAHATFGPDGFMLSVRDNGRGWPADTAPGRGMGNMGARIRELGGSMTRACNGGAELVFRLPLPIQPAHGHPDAPNTHAEPEPRNPRNPIP